MVFSNVSVITPVYNASPFLKKAVESVLQFGEVKEIILVEDASTDDSYELCKALLKQESRIKLFTHPGQINQGAAASRNLGIKKASGDFIAFLDADDYYLPNRFDAEKELFENPEVDGVYGALGVHFHIPESKEVYTKRFRDSVSKSNLTTLSKKIPPEDLFKNLWGFGSSSGYFHLDTLTLRADPIRKNNAYFNESLGLGEDTEYLYRLAYEYRLYPGIIDREIACRGVHEGNRTTDAGDMKKLYTDYYKMYASMYGWGLEKNLDKIYMDIFKEKMRLFEFRKSSPLKKLITLPRYVFHHPDKVLKKIFR